MFCRNVGWSGSYSPQASGLRPKASGGNTMGRVVLSLFVVAALAGAQEPVRPVVPGFERFGDQDPVEGGRLLLGELGCVSCHKPEAAVAAHFSIKQAPLLDEVGSRLRREWLVAWLSGPHKAKPGTTMPGVLRDKTEVEPIVHYLMTRRAPRPPEEVSGPGARGREIYAQVGCAACHGALDGKEDPGAVPLGDLKAKYAGAGALAEFLRDPLKGRPSGRMPKMNLTAQEAAALGAHFVGLPPREADDPGETAPGLAFEYFEGSWSKLPEFDRLKPAASGVHPVFEVRPIKREDHVALRFRGLLDVPREGLYTLSTSSDDGSRLLLGRTGVVENDGLHGTTEVSGTIHLKPGKHAITVEWFEASGGEELNVHWEGPGIPRQVVPAAALSHAKKLFEPSESRRAEALFVPDPALVERGRRLYYDRRCADCHEPAGKAAPPAGLALAPLPTLAALREAKAPGCMNDRPEGPAPHFKLSAPQVAAIKAALANLGPEPPTVAQRIDRSMTALNCWACHERAGKGGVPAERYGLFLGADATMGDEGRVPPSLTGAGAKLRREWMQKVLADGTKVRPYMHARMPVFGPEAAHLGEDLEKADAPGPAPAPVPRDRLMLQAGRQLTGTKGLSCITCHMFKGHKSLGIPGMDLVQTATRLRRDWFDRYLLEPSALRPGTRMPTYWPEGKGVLKEVLGGDARAQIDALWQYLAEGVGAQLPAGIGPQPILLAPQAEPVVYRNFIQGAGPRAIGVGYPEKVNLAFDANHLRLALLWQGDFIDASKHWVDRGSGFQSPAGENVFALHAGPPLAELADPKAPWPAAPKSASEKVPGLEFLGYDLDAKRRPTFFYRWGAVKVSDFFEPSADGRLKRVFEMTVSGAAPSAAWFRAGAGRKIERQADGSFKVDGALSLRVEGAEPLLRPADLLVPVRFMEGKAAFAVHYGW